MGERRDMGIGCLYLEKEMWLKGAATGSIYLPKDDVQHLYVHMSICYTAVINVGSLGKGDLKPSA